MSTLFFIRENNIKSLGKFWHVKKQNYEFTGVSTVCKFQISAVKLIL